VGPRAGLDIEARGKFLSPLPGIRPRSPGRPARSQTLYCLSYLSSFDVTLFVPNSSSRSIGVLTCEISSSHGGEYEVQNLLGCTAVFLI
jgi:hypothetical protein